MAMQVLGWVVVVGFLFAGIVLAMATTTDNKMRWAVLAPLTWGVGTLIAAVMLRNWSPMAVSSGMFFYAAINYRNIKRGRA